MGRKDNGLGLSAIEYKNKTVLDKYTARFYCTTNKEIASALIELGKYLYYTEKQPHHRTGKIVTIFYYEMIREIHEDIRRIKAKLDEKYKNKKKKPNNNREGEK